MYKNSYIPPVFYAPQQPSYVVQQTVTPVYTPPPVNVFVGSPMQVDDRLREPECCFWSVHNGLLMWLGVVCGFQLINLSIQYSFLPEANPSQGYTDVDVKSIYILTTWTFATTALSTLVSSACVAFALISKSPKNLKNAAIFFMLGGLYNLCIRIYYWKVISGQPGISAVSTAINLVFTFLYTSLIINRVMAQRTFILENNAGKTGISGGYI